MRFLTRLVILLALLAPTAALSESGIQLLPSYQLLTVSDPEGSSTAGDFSPFLIRWMRQASYDSAWYGDLGYLSNMGTDAGATAPGVTVSGFQLGGGYAWRYRMSRDLKPWLSLGVRITQAEYTERHTVDSDGFLTAVFPDNSESAVNLVGSVSNTWPIAGKLGVGVWLEYGAKLTGSLSWFGAGCALSYEY